MERPAHDPPIPQRVGRRRTAGRSDRRGRRTYRSPARRRRAADIVPLLGKREIPAGVVGEAEAERHRQALDRSGRCRAGESGSPAPTPRRRVLDVTVVLQRRERRRSASAESKSAAGLMLDSGSNRPNAPAAADRARRQHPPGSAEAAHAELRRLRRRDPGDETHSSERKSAAHSGTLEGKGQQIGHAEPRARRPARAGSSSRRARG